MLPVAGLACGGDGGTDVVLPSLSIRTATTGAELDPDGYSVTVDTRAAQPIGTEASVTIDRLAEGDHTVALSGVAPNCAVEGENPQTVRVTPGATATVVFTVTCAAGTGAVQVATATTGTSTDADGFALLLDGADRGAIGPSASMNLTGLEPGVHSVGLTGIAANCQVAGENPRAVTVTAGQTANLSFAVTCTEAGAATGNIEISTTTTGPDQDPDGYLVSVDAGAGQPIATTAVVTLSGVGAGLHEVQLAGLAANCSVTGTTALQVTVPDGGTVRATFAVVCAASSEASVQVTVATSGSSIDPDGYTISVDGGSGAAITVNGSRTITGLSPGNHSIQLVGVAANCQVTGDNPIGVAVAQGERVTVSFAVNCGATLGQLTVNVAGLPASVDAAVSVTGPNSFSQTVTATRSLTGLVPGNYTVSASNVASGGTTYRPSISRPTVSLAAGGSEAVTVTYAGQADITLNLRIDGLYLTQSTQTYGSAVPLVSGRAAYLRVFVVANEANTARPSVRVRLSRPGVSARTFTIAASSSAPREVHEDALESSWNLEVPGSLIQSGLSVVAEVDPDDEIEESNESDNTLTKTVTVQAVPAARVRFVSVQQGSSPPGDISNPGQLMSLARRMHPLNAVTVEAHPAIFTASTPLEANDAGWEQVLGDLDAKRLTDPDGADWIYFGIARLPYGRNDGTVGKAFTGIPTATTALGWDDASDAGRVVAHELGHIWGRAHAPCNNPPDVDAAYPYPNGRIGVFGLDAAPSVTAADLKAPTSPDIMGYCFNGPWISDYNYRGVMAYRRANAASVAQSAVPQPAMLVWGRIVNGRPVLEPAMRIVARTSLPTRRGPYSIIGTSVEGAQLFALSFDAAKSVDGAREREHFAFAIPLDPAKADRLASIRLTGPGGTAVNARSLAVLRTAGQEPVAATREGQSVALRWDAAVYPTVMVRDPDTGEVISFARGGNARVWTGKSELMLELSDGVGSQRVRLAISRP